MSSAIKAVFVLFSGMEVRKDPETGKEIFVGDMKVDFNPILQLYFDPFNYTILKCANLATDCVSSLISQEGDVLIARANFDTIPSNQSVYPFQPLGQDGYFIVSPYNCTVEKALEDSVTTDVTNVANAFSRTVWIFTLMTLISFAILICIHFSNEKNNNEIMIRSPKKMKGRRLGEKQKYQTLMKNLLYSVCTVISYVLFNPSFKISNNSTKLISLIMSTFVLLVIVSYFKNAITTDRIRIKEQKIFKSYQDIADDIDRGHNLTFLFAQQSSLLHRLTNYPYNPVKDRLYNHIKNPSTQKINAWPLMLEKITSQDHDYVIIEGQLTTRIMKFLGCTMMQSSPGKSAPDTCLHRTEEMVNEGQRVFGALCSKSFTINPVYAELRKRATRISQAGLMGTLQSLVRDGASEFARLDCLSESSNLIKHEPGLQSMDIPFFFNGIHIIAGLILFALIMLEIEHCWNYIEKNLGQTYEWKVVAVEYSPRESKNKRC